MLVSPQNRLTASITLSTIFQLPTPTVISPTVILSTSDDYTDDATIQPDDPTLVTLL